MLQVLVTKIIKKNTPFVLKGKMERSNELLLKQFGKHVKEIRLGKNLSQDEVVANSARITKGTISDIENGKRNFSFTTLIDLCKGLEAHPKELLDFKFDPTSIK